jgi:hypothetical protein
MYQHYVLLKVPRVTYRWIEGRNWSADHRTQARVFYEHASGHRYIRIIQTMGWHLPLSNRERCCSPQGRECE